jgi:phage shock protein PspC (stress-responsive transcriptional regulator)
MPAPELTRRSDDKILGGVCAALARRFDVVCHLDDQRQQ